MNVTADSTIRCDSHNGMLDDLISDVNVTSWLQDQLWMSHLGCYFSCDYYTGIF